MTEKSEATAVRLVEMFQSAAFGLLPWEAPLSALAEATGATIGQLAVLDARGDLFVNLCSGVSDADTADYIAWGGPDPAVNLRTRAIVGAPVLQCLLEGDYTSPDQLAKDPFYNEFFLPRDLPFSCLTKLFQDGGGVAGLTLLMPARHGHVDEQTQRFVAGIVPRIADVVRGSLGLARTQIDALATLAAHAHGNAILLDRAGRIQSATEGAEAWLRAGTHLTSRGGSLMCANARSQCELARSLAKIGGPAGPGRPLHLSIDLADLAGRGAVQAELIALPQPVHAGLVGVCAVLILPDRVVEDPVAMAALRRRFGLTPAEAAVCALLASGADARAIADQRGSSLGTVRNQIKVALEKTGTKRQLDLVLRIAQVQR